jgi:hypothetical protein
MPGEDCGRTAEGVVVAAQHHSTPTVISARALTRSADRAAAELSLDLASASRKTL